MADDAIYEDVALGRVLHGPSEIASFVEEAILLPAMTGAAFLTWFVVFTGALWVVVATVALANGSQLSRQPIRLRRV